jgi:hypothetical protein
METQIIIGILAGIGSILYTVAWAVVIVKVHIVVFKWAFKKKRK